MLVYSNETKIAELTSIKATKTKVARIANAKVKSLHFSLIGFVSFVIVHIRMVIHIAIITKETQETDIRTGPVEYGFSKLGVTPGGGRSNGILDRTDSGVCRICERLPSSIRLNKTPDGDMRINRE